MGLAFVPLYIRYLGIESYGLIGIFAMLQSWLTLLDMGMKPSLGREMARFTAGARDVQSIRDLLRSVETIAFSVGALIISGVWAGSGYLASNWVTVTALPVHVVAQSFAVMGFVVALRFIEDIYLSSIAGLQRQVLQNIVTSSVATARGLGAIAVLAWISPSIRAYFIWQGLVSLTSVALLGSVVYRTLPPAQRRARFSAAALIGIWRFAAGMMAITFLSLLLMQSDKILLSRLLTLKAYGYYALATVVAGGLYSLVAPITGAFYPRFTELAALGDEVVSRAAYHRGAQLVTVFMGSAAVVLIVFHKQVMLLWTNDEVLASQVAPLMAVLAFGTMLNALMWIPYQMMLAHAWTSLTIRINIVSVCLQAPALLWAVRRYGVIGAAWVWVAINGSYVIFTISLMHRRLLPGEKWRWYSQDVGVPLAVATGVAWLCRRLTPDHFNRIEELGSLLLSGGCALFASALAVPAGRDQLSRHLPDVFRRCLLPIIRLRNDRRLGAP
jgi:O-antigen/teichoic acid export membrane protein